MSPEKTLRFHGIDGESGDYLLAPRRADEMGSLLAAFTESAAPKRLGHGLDPNDLAAAGWAVIWREGGDPVRRAAPGRGRRPARQRLPARGREPRRRPGVRGLGPLLDPGRLRVGRGLRDAPGPARAASG